VLPRRRGGIRGNRTGVSTFHGCRACARKSGMLCSFVNIPLPHEQATDPSIRGARPGTLAAAYAGLIDDAAPFLVLVADVGRELPGVSPTASDLRRAGSSSCLPSASPSRFAGHALDHRLRGCGRRDEAVPVHHDDARHAGFRERRHAGGAQGRASRASPRARAQPPGFTCAIDEMIVGNDTCTWPPTSRYRPRPCPCTARGSCACRRRT